MVSGEMWSVFFIIPVGLCLYGLVEGHRFIGDGVGPHASPDI